MSIWEKRHYKSSLERIVRKRGSESGHRLAPVVEEMKSAWTVWADRARTADGGQWRSGAGWRLVAAVH